MLLDGHKSQRSHLTLDGAEAAADWNDYVSVRMYIMQCHIALADLSMYLMHERPFISGHNAHVPLCCPYTSLRFLSMYLMQGTSDAYILL